MRSPIRFNLIGAGGDAFGRDPAGFYEASPVVLFETLGNLLNEIQKYDLETLLSS